MSFIGRCFPYRDMSCTERCLQRDVVSLAEKCPLQRRSPYRVVPFTVVPCRVAVLYREVPCRAGFPLQRGLREVASFIWRLPGAGLCWVVVSISPTVYAGGGQSLFSLTLIDPKWMLMSLVTFPVAHTCCSPVGPQLTSDLTIPAGGELRSFW